MPTRFMLAIPLAPSSMCPDSWLHSGTSTALRAAVGFGASGLSPPGLGLCSLIGCSGFPTWRSVRLGAGGGGARGWVAGWEACGCSSALACNCGCIPLTPGHPTSTCDAGVKYYYIIFKRFVCVVLGALLARRGVAWRSSSAAFLLVPLLPSTFLVYGLPLRPGFSFFFFRFSLRFGGLFISLSLGF